MPKPTRIKREEGRSLHITWDDGRESDHDARALRGACPCATCVEEWTGVRVFGPDQVPEELTYTEVELVGNYAIQLHFSDGHHTGIYTFRNLREMAEEAG